MPDFGLVLAVVPARGGSKGIPLKNLRTVGGKTLLARTLELALEIPELSEICVSTDHEQIKAAVHDYPTVRVVDRPEELSGDRVADTPVLQHAVTAMEARVDMRFDTVVMLQVTSPLRTADDIYSCLDLISSSRCDSVWTVSPTELHYHPLKQLVIGDDSKLSLYDERGLDIIARQQLGPVFHRNGCCYALRRDFLMEAHSLYSSDSNRAVVSVGERVNIDGEPDVVLAERLLNHRGT